MAGERDDRDDRDEADEAAPGRRSRPHRQSVMRDGDGSHDDDMQRIARNEVIRGFESVGIDVATFEGRQRHAELLVAMRERKAAREGGRNKLVTAGLGAAVSAVVAAIATYLSGFRH